MLQDEAIDLEWTTGESFGNGDIDLFLLEAIDFSRKVQSWSNRMITPLINEDLFVQFEY